ncbi:hypothetical protein SISSUDRAFT_1037762 [Sistotremastrum suecicum HHB10207 ss-3]|uniref:Uncharacterized protein n=1 Tax=Sistotremastrum suecicum HHB10207 ss-3 TaxID=1314776 RepID=A0A165XPD0_9AGAM|nr:hypothetical protein SISSUDRAFT_1037762 [Sistotremastrum suecicum HHB10207 ss-3]
MWVVETPFSSPAGGVKLLESDLEDSPNAITPNIDEDDEIEHNEHNDQVPYHAEPQHDDQAIESEENQDRGNIQAENRSDEETVANEENQADGTRSRPRAPRRRIDYGPPSRKSRRNEGLEAEHYVPLDGAPVPETAETQEHELHDLDNESELSDVPSGAGYMDNDDDITIRHGAKIV